MMNEIERYFDKCIQRLFYDSTCRIQHPQLSDRDCHRLSVSVRRIIRLERLSFYRCPHVGIRGIKDILLVISRLLRNNQQKSSIELEISSVNLEDDGLQILADLVFPSEDQNRFPVVVLKSLELEDIGFVQPQTWRMILPRALHSRFHLQTLDLTHNYLTLETISVLANLLECNHVLENLILSENPMIGDAGTAILCKALKKNSTLKVLSLAVCNISNAGIQTLTDCIRFHNNTHLTRIYLFGNPQNDNREKEILSYWLELNAIGRSAMRGSICSAMIPTVLSSPSNHNRPDLLYGLLRELPHVWCPKRGSSLY